MTHRLINEVGIPVNVEDDDGWTALMFAAMMGYNEPMQVLLQCGCDVSLKEHQGCTAMDFAKEENHLKSVAIMEKQ